MIQPALDGHCLPTSQPPCLVIVMAKAPLPGLAKTRLMSALGAEGAARVAQHLLAHTLQQALAANVGPVRLCCTPDPSHPAWASWARVSGMSLHAQGGGDLGQRMVHAFDEAGAVGPPRTGARHMLMIGTDAPALTAARLQEAALALVRHDVVLVPALDGGYALVGLQRLERSLFDGVPWSTSGVMTATRTRLHRAQLSHTELAPVADIDEPADLVHWPDNWPELVRLDAPMEVAP